MFTQYQKVDDVGYYSITISNENGEVVYKKKISDLPTIRYFQNYNFDSSEKKEHFRSTWMKNQNLESIDGMYFSVLWKSANKDYFLEKRINEKTLFTSKISPKEL